MARTVGEVEHDLDLARAAWSTGRGSEAACAALEDELADLAKVSDAPKAKRTPKPRSRKK